MPHNVRIRSAAIAAPAFSLHAFRLAPAPYRRPRFSPSVRDLKVAWPFDQSAPTLRTVQEFFALWIQSHNEEVTALVLSAGAMFAAWQVGVWKALSGRFQPDLVVGASAGALNAWAIAGGASPEALKESWLDPTTYKILRLRRPEALFQVARSLYDRFQPCLPIAVPLVEVPRLRSCLVRNSDIHWEHLAASCSIPLWFPSVRIGDKRYVDGGLRAALPLWAAEEMGATRAIAVSAFELPVADLLRRVVVPRMASGRLTVIQIRPSEPLGPLHHAMIWSRERLRRWMDLGEYDGNTAVSRL